MLYPVSVPVILMAVLIPVFVGALSMALVYLCWQKRKKYITEKKLNDDSWQLDLSKLLQDNDGTDLTHSHPRMSGFGGASGIILPAITVGNRTSAYSLKQKPSDGATNDQSGNAVDSPLPSRSGSGRFGSEQAGSQGARSASL